MKGGPRCLEPMLERKDGDINPVCWRPKGHNPETGHQSKKSYDKAQKQRAAYYQRLVLRRESWRQQGEN